MEKIRVGVSSCLLGEQVRFDGGHKHERYLTKVLSDYFEYIPLCPEVAIGLGIPRPTLRLVRNEAGENRIITQKTGADSTDKMRQYADEVVPRLERNQISGYVFKSKSPSCGMARVKVYGEDNNPLESAGIGVYAQRLMEKMPHLPVEEEGRLNDLPLREHFIKRVYVYKDWQDNVESNVSVQSLIDFQTRHKLMFTLHHYGNSKKLGQLVANVTDENLAQTAAAYLDLMTETMKLLPKRRHHGQVLTRVVATINKELDDAQKHDILHMIDEYTSGEIPLATPMRLIKHYLTKVDNAFLKQQSYLNPYPEKLGLMNAI